MTADKNRDDAETMNHEWVRLGYLIQDVSRMQQTLFDKSMKSATLTGSQWWVLANLRRTETQERTTITDLSGMLDISKVTLTGLIDRLEVAGYVRRQVDPADRRNKFIEMTTDGELILDQMRAVTDEINKEIFLGVNRKGYARMEKDLQVVKANLRRMLQK